MRAKRSHKVRVDGKSVDLVRIKSGPEPASPVMATSVHTERAPSILKDDRHRIAIKLAFDGKAQPLDVLMGTMRRIWKDGTCSDEEALEACAIAEKAAPYMHPKLAAVAIKDETGPNPRDEAQARYIDTIIEMMRVTLADKAKMIEGKS